MAGGAAQNRTSELNFEKAPHDNWFSIENRDDGRARIDLYDGIGVFGTSAKDFLGELRTIKAKAIDLHINSEGGDVFDGIAIYHALKQHPATVAVSVDSLAASIASVIAMAGDTIEMALPSHMFIHEPFAGVLGPRQEMRKAADALDLMAESIAGIYAARSHQPAAKWLSLMAEEKWFAADRAVSEGLADRVSAASAGKNNLDLSIFRNGPQATGEPAEEKTPLAIADWRRSARLAVAAAELSEVR